MGQTNFSAIGLKQDGEEAVSLFSACFEEEAVIDVASLADGAGATSDPITVTGAAFGDFVLVSASIDVQGVRVFGYVSAADTVELRFENETGGTIDLGSATYYIKVLRG